MTEATTPTSAAEAPTVSTVAAKPVAVTGVLSGLEAGAQADLAAVKAEGKSLFAKVAPYLYPALALALGVLVGKHI